MPVTTVRELIEALKKTPCTLVRDSRGLLAALEELDALTGMDDAKQSAIDQTLFLIVKLANSTSTTKPKDLFDGHMLHSLIYGPPGTGKTKLGIIMAKIWRAIGVINGTPPTPPAPKITADMVLANFRMHMQLQHVQRKHNKLEESLRTTRYFLRKARSQIRSGNKWLEKAAPPRIRRRKTWTTAKTESTSAVDYLNEASDELSTMEEILQEDDPDFAVPEKDSDAEDSPIKIVGRAELVGKYVGHTAIKVKKLLTKNLGKVVFIDEAYALLDIGHRSFGSEALTAINKFMSEHAGEIVIIMAGYKDRMLELLEDQPGLKRRFTWVFDVKDYGPNDLSRIFAQQASQSAWTVDTAVQLPSFFTLNKTTFPGFGGDTERLLFYCKLAHAQIAFDTTGPGIGQVIDSRILTAALNRLQKNQTDKPDTRHHQLYS